MKLRLLRESRGWTQQELGDLLNCHRMTVSSWENGIATPQRSYIQKMRYIFGDGTINRSDFVIEEEKCND